MRALKPELASCMGKVMVNHHETYTTYGSYDHMDLGFQGGLVSNKPTWCEKSWMGCEGNRAWKFMEIRRSTGTLMDIPKTNKIDQSI